MERSELLWLLLLTSCSVDPIVKFDVISTFCSPPLYANTLSPLDDCFVVGFFFVSVFSFDVLFLDSCRSIFRWPGSAPSENEKAKLDKLGILHSIRGIHDLDEASGAYKDIQMVIDNQLDLVKIEVELSPLAVIKG